jgi:hypothetical protein
MGVYESRSRKAAIRDLKNLGLKEHLAVGLTELAREFGTVEIPAWRASSDMPGRQEWSIRVMRDFIHSTYTVETSVRTADVIDPWAGF